MNRGASAPLFFSIILIFYLYIINVNRETVTPQLTLFHAAFVCYMIIEKNVARKGTQAHIGRKGKVIS